MSKFSKNQDKKKTSLTLIMLIGGETIGADFFVLERLAFNKKKNLNISIYFLCNCYQVDL
jgi:hypothetical protein